MENNFTFTIIKPTAVQKNYHGAILKEISENGFKIIALKMIHMTKSQAEDFYAVHKGKPFYEKLTNFMSSGPVIVAILQASDAVKAYRKFIGATNPEDAMDGTIRDKFGTSLSENAVHGSDSDENAEIESNFFFSKTERFEY